MKKRTAIFIAIWTIAFIIALCLDSPIAQWVHNSGTGRFVEGKGWAQILKEPGHFGFTVAVAVMLLLTKQIRLKGAAFVLLAGIAAGIHGLLKWIVGRTRPYKLPGPTQPRPFDLQPFRHGLPGFFHQTDLSFPSGHACEAFALLASTLLVWPRGRWIFICCAGIVAIERVLENAHYASDVVAAAGFGTLTTFVLYKFLSGWIEPATGDSFAILP